MNPQLADTFGRPVNYARFSVTNACNFACLYCQEAPSGLSQNSLAYAEILRLARILAGLGVQKFRFTGGEPFLRPGFMDFLAAFVAEHPRSDIRVTTNGAYVAEHAETLAKLGIGVNFSLDTFNPTVFAQLTRTSPAVFKDVQKGLHALLLHHVPLKINAVALRPINKVELSLFLEFARQYAVDVRFIEPMAFGKKYRQHDIWTGPEILAEAQKLVRLTPLPQQESTDGPARMFSLSAISENIFHVQGKGRFGLITPRSQHFCATCNRVRVLHNGNLRLCLYSQKEIRLAPLLRHPAMTDARLARVLTLAVQRKPMGNSLAGPAGQPDLAQIGG